MEAGAVCPAVAKGLGAGAVLNMLFGFSGVGSKEKGLGVCFAGGCFNGENGDETEANGLGAVDEGAVGAPPKLPLNMEENGLGG